MCAGAIGPAVVKKIRGFSLSIDERVVRRIADGYEIHGRDVSVTVRHPERGQIYTVFRGGGPVRACGGAKSFDQFLLDAAVAGSVVFLLMLRARLPRNWELVLRIAAPLRTRGA